MAFLAGLMTGVVCTAVVIFWVLRAELGGMND